MGTCCTKVDKAIYTSPANKRVTSKQGSKKLTSDITGSDTTVSANRSEFISQSSGDLTEGIGIKSFNTLKVLGRGSIGTVTLAKHKASGETYALKAVTKPSLKSDEQIEEVMFERHLLLRLKHPFVAGLHYSFQTNSKLYFVFDYLQGGTLENVIAKKGKLSETQARFYL